jgi:predicted enzyme related to lactoylglutathione lyase
MSGIGIQELAFVGYSVNDLAESRRFYGELLGLPEGMVFEHEGEVGWVEYSIPCGATLAITKATAEWQPSEHGGGACFEVADLDAAVAKLEAQGVRIVLPPQDYPVCRISLIADPSGNTVALHQKKPHHPECSH